MVDTLGIKDELASELGISRRAVTMRVLRFGRKHGIAPPEHALYVYALDHEVTLSSYGVDSESQSRASDLLRSIRSKPEKPPVSTSKSGASQQSQLRKIQLEAGSANLGSLPTLLASSAGSSHERSASAYRIFYLIENSAREVIRRVLTRKHGKAKWWIEGVDPKIQKAASGRRKQDESDPWHEPRGDHDIHYIDLHHYADIITSSVNWPLFKPIFKVDTFVTETLRRINVSRRVVAHMNGLKKDDYDHLKAQATAWFKTLSRAESDGHVPQ